MFGLIRLVPDSNSKAASIAWIVAIAVAGFAVSSATSRFTVRLLPLAALMRLSLVFPDQAPSRLKLAIRASSRKRLRIEVESARHHGLSSDATEAAGQLLLLTSALGEHDRRTRGHSERVRLYSRLLGEEMGLKGDDLERLQWGALLHDVGKLTIPAEILNKPGTLDQTEWAIMAGHAAAGGELAAPLHPFLGPFVQAADGHHEKWDGSGYPLGLRGEEIPLAARIVAVADAYEVMTATRAYKKPMSSEAARAELTACAGTHFDPDVVRAWLRVSVGDANRAAGPVAMLAGLPLIGELVALFARTATQISAVPAAVATLAPAAATAGAMTMAVVAGQPLPSAPEQIAFELPEIMQMQSEPTTTTTTTTTTQPAVAESTTTVDLFATTTVAPSTTAPPTTTGAPTTTAPTTAAPATTVPTTTAPTTTSTAPTTTTEAAPPPAPRGELVGTGGASLTVHGPIAPGADLNKDGPYDDGSHLFRDGPQTLAADLTVGAVTIPAGTTVCVDLFLTFEADEEKTWRIDYASRVLAITGPEQELADTDFLSAPGVDYGSGNKLGLDNNDEAFIRQDGTRVRLRLKGGSVDQVRILIDCGS